MGKYNKRKASQEIYEIRKTIEDEFYSHIFFSISSEQAAELILKKLGTLHTIIIGNELKFKQQLNLDFPIFDMISFFQESLNEIFKGLILTNRKKERISNCKITVQEILDLMSTGYKIALFRKYEYFHSKDVVKVTFNKKNRLDFNYVNDDLVKYNITYDVLFRDLETYENRKEIEKRKLDDIFDVLDFSHRQMFQLNVDIDFGEFTLKDYIEFSTVLNKIIIRGTYQFYIVANEYGFEKCKLNEWVKKIKNETNLSSKKIEKIISFLTFDFTDSRSDISLSYFIPVNGELMVLNTLFMMQRLDTNIIRLLNMKNRPKFDNEQKKFEEHQVYQLINNLDSRYLIERGKKALPGVDLLVYNPFQNDLHIIELKFKLPIDSAQEIIKLDQQNLKKALIQNKKAEFQIDEHSVLGEYFGKRFINKKPKKIQYFTLTNYSIGIGTKTEMPSPILLTDHYLRLMNSPIGNALVSDALRRNDKGMPRKFTKRFSKIALYNFQFVIPMHGAEFINIREFIDEHYCY